MTKLEETYRQIGGDWEGVTKRLMGESLVQRFVKKFIEEDKSFCQLKEALSVGDVKAAFMAAHTLKGVCQSLGFDGLFKPTNELTELLRAESLEGSDVLFSQVEEQYNRIVESLAPCLQALKCLKTCQQNLNKQLFPERYFLKNLTQEHEGFKVSTNDEGRNKPTRRK